MRAILLLIPCVLAVLTPLYNSVEPRIAGFPMFYWYLLILVPVSSLFVYAASKVGSDRDGGR